MKNITEMLEGVLEGGYTEEYGDMFDRNKLGVYIVNVEKYING